LPDHQFPLRNTHIANERPPFECIALLLQGGGALGAYQAGVYEAMAEANLHPDWVAGISIGAINAALIAGNAPAQRVAKLRSFWETVSRHPLGLPYIPAPAITDERMHFLINQARGLGTLLFGAPGFFRPRLFPPHLFAHSNTESLSFCDVGALKSTLEHLVDFDRINAAEMRFSVGATNIKTRQDTLAFQIDLWNARGELPRDLAHVNLRQTEIRYSSRTRAGTDQFRTVQGLLRATSKLLAKLPEDLRRTPEAILLAKEADEKVYNIIQMIYRAKKYEGNSMDHEFSRATMEEHWKAGYEDAVSTLRHPEVLERPKSLDGVFTFDLGAQGRAATR
jgi:NTE family protein